MDNPTPPNDEAAPVARLALLVDDNPANTTILAALLRRFGYRTEITNDSREAIEAVRRCRPDVILLDIHMPIFDGYHIARAIQQDAALKRIPIVAVTALDDDNHLRRSLEVGIAHQITKPVEIAKLDELIQRLVGSA